MTRTRALLVTLAAVVSTAVAPISAGAAPPHPPPPPPPGSQLELGSEIVVKLDPGCSIEQVTSAFPVVVDRALLASRGIYLVQPTAAAKIADDPKQAAGLAKKIAGMKSVVAYAETDQSVQLADTQFHGWPYGQPQDASSDPSTYTDQPMVSALQLAAVHATTEGAGIKIAVLDTGADPDQPALAGRLGPGWNYIDDNANTDDVATGLDENGDGIADSAYGHGTFVSGIAALVAPGATILPYRVLDSDGYGSLYEIAQAILDATAQGANVINLSFGTAAAITSHVLLDAITAAQHAGVIVVGAAGNDGNNRPHFPAAQAGVISTSALASDDSSLASFSDWGKWADVAAPGQNVVGPLPGDVYAHWAGTSMAAPVVSGQAALLLAARPGIQAKQVSAAITGSANRLARNPVHFGAVNLTASLGWLATHH